MIRDTLLTGIALDKDITALNNSLLTIEENELNSYQPEALKAIIDLVAPMDNDQFVNIVTYVRDTLTTMRDTKQTTFDDLQDPDPAP